MERLNIKVYVKIDTENHITAIASSIFLTDTTDWIQIDEGYGDKYAHAQNQYLEKHLMDKQGRYNYKLIDGVVVEVAEEDKPTYINNTSNYVTVEQRLDALESAMLELIIGGIS